MYVAINHKPENGCKIQNAADGRSWLMMQLMLDKTAEQGANVAEEHGGLIVGQQYEKDLYYHGLCLIDGFVLTLTLLVSGQPRRYTIFGYISLGGEECNKKNSDGFSNFC